MPIHPSVVLLTRPSLSALTKSNVTLLAEGHEELCEEACLGSEGGSAG